MRTWILVSTLLLSLASYGAWAQDVEPPMQEAPTQAPAMEPPVQDTPAAPAPSMEPPQQEPTPPPTSTPQTTPPPVETPEEILATEGQKVRLPNGESIVTKKDKVSGELVVERKDIHPKPGVWRDQVLYRGRAPRSSAERRRVVHTQILPALERSGISQAAILKLLEDRFAALRKEFRKALAAEEKARIEADNGLRSDVDTATILAGEAKEEAQKAHGVTAEVNKRIRDLENWRTGLVIGVGMIVLLLAFAAWGIWRASEKPSGFTSPNP